MASETNIAKKAEKVSAVKEKLEKCQMLFATSLSGLSVAQVYELRQKIPASTTCMTVKNSLMKRAIEESEWAHAGDFTSGSNLWFFVEEDIKGSVETFKTFSKDLKREPIKGGVFDGELCDEKKISAIAALPSKKELMQQIAASINMVPTKLGKSIKAVPSKVGRAIKLAVANEDEGGDAPAE